MVCLSLMLGNQHSQYSTPGGNQPGNRTHPVDTTTPTTQALPAPVNQPHQPANPAANPQEPTTHPTRRERQPPHPHRQAARTPRATQEHPTHPSPHTYNTTLHTRRPSQPEGGRQGLGTGG